MILLALMALFAATEPVTPNPSENRWAEPTRGILAQHCGRCHLPNLPTSVPRALAVFDLTDTVWYGRLENDQFDDLLRRLESIKSLPEADRAIVSSFVRCARDRDCPSADR